MYDEVVNPYLGSRIGSRIGQGSKKHLKKNVKNKCMKNLYIYV